MDSPLVSLAFAGLVACGGPRPSDHVGTVTSAAQDAFKQWCAKGRLEMESKLEGIPQDSPARTNPNLLVMHCYRTTPEEYDPMVESGWLAFDTKSEQLISLVADLHPSTARDFLGRVLAPSLDEEQKKKLDELVAWAPTQSPGSKRWDTPALVLAIDTYPRGGNQSEPTWNVFALTSLARKKR